MTPGELGTVMIIATDRKQARVYRYAAALLREVPMLKAMLQRETAEAIELTNGIRVEILTSSFRAVRGYTLIAALCDEIAFWTSDESANPDSEIIEQSETRPEQHGPHPAGNSILRKASDRRVDGVMRALEWCVHAIGRSGLRLAPTPQGHRQRRIAVVFCPPS